MIIGSYTVSKKQLISLIIVIILLISLPLTLYLVKTRQIFKPRATGNTPEAAFQFTDSSGSPLPRTGNTITTNSQNIKIQLTDPEALTQP